MNVCGSSLRPLRASGLRGGKRPEPVSFGGETMGREKRRAKVLLQRSSHGKWTGAEDIHDPKTIEI